MSIDRRLAAFLFGTGSVLDLSGSGFAAKQPVYHRRSVDDDAVNLYGDWIAVAGDFRRAFKKTCDRHGLVYEYSKTFTTRVPAHLGTEQLQLKFVQAARGSVKERATEESAAEERAVGAEKSSVKMSVAG